MSDAPESTSTRPYLIRALYEWCSDNGFTPYLSVSVNESVQVPLEFVQNGEIVLNIGLDATSSLQLGNEFIEFKARFAGTAREIMVPVGQVMAIYARENGQGMSFPLLASKSPPAKSSLSSVIMAATDPALDFQSNSKPVQLSRVETSNQNADTGEPSTPPRTPSSAARPTLKRVK